eukprot:CAMPEP_0174886886 /NCGR_PEP_ID=MMETSP0167-20121228/2131_1 /TAXON_ID=38298 /ORGANISM="Rhodella maculata, Strain CCMP736" /LENGTH=223 /DNA_ID=CAMNT_0016123111 /DNA_START=63 /DNA_END=732 /DNA_ORIENTATION=+
MYFTTNDDVRIFYEDSAPSGGASDLTLVLIHGWSGSHRAFKHNFEPLANTLESSVSHHNPTIHLPLRTPQKTPPNTFPLPAAFDLRGHGASDKPSHGLHVARLALDLHNLLTHLALPSPPVLLGTSLGSALIWSLLELFPASARAAIFVDQAPLQNVKPDGTWRTQGSKGIFDAASTGFVLGQLVANPSAFHAGTPAACMGRAPTEAEIGFFGAIAGEASVEA